MGNAGRRLREGSLFTGAGGGLLGSHLLGWDTVFACELEQYATSVLLGRQRDGILDRFPIWDDVRTFDGMPWRGKIDVLTGGFPCQDISAAGNGAGITGARSGLWKEYARIIDEVRPEFVFAENSPMLRTRGLGVVLEDLGRMGYDARWCVLGAWHVGANHKRNRMWVLAHAPQVGRRTRGQGRSDPGGEGESEQSPQNLVDANETQRKRGRISVGGYAQHAISDMAGQRPEWWLSEPGVGRVANGVASRVDRLKVIGNGQVPLVAATAWRLLTHDMKGV